MLKNSYSNIKKWLRLDFFLDENLVNSTFKPV